MTTIQKEIVRKMKQRRCRIRVWFGAARDTRHAYLVGGLEDVSTRSVDSMEKKGIIVKTSGIEWRYTEYELAPEYRTEATP